MSSRGSTPSNAAIAADYAIETDLQITADGEAVVHHDATLGRLTEASGALAAMTAAELKRVTRDLPEKQPADFWQDLFFALLCSTESAHNR